MANIVAKNKNLILSISGLKEALLILKDVEGVGMVFLDDNDVIRHKLVKDVIDAYKNIENLE